MTAPALTLYFDGNCPFCASEMRRLKRWNKAGHLAFADVAEPGFDPAPLGVTAADLDRELHSRTASGEILVGIDSMLVAYTLVGKGWLVAPLRIRWLRPVLANLYRRFARNRYRFSRWFGYKPVVRCKDGVCRVGNPFLK
jgi:predicted DCC family thiol-disulfide oxidoreductase YuxK